MIAPAEEAALRDEWCVTLLERTSSVEALVRAWRESHEAVPVYDHGPRPPAVRRQPRDRVGACETCGEQYLPGRNPDRQRYCSRRCRYRARSATSRSLVRQRYPAARAAS